MTHTIRRPGSRTAPAALALAPVLALVASVAASAADGGAPLDFDLLFAENASGRLATSPAWDPTGARVAYLWADGDGEGVWLQETGGGRSLLLRPADLDASLAAVEALHWSPAGDALLLEADGDLYLAPVAGGPVRRLTAGPEVESDPAFSPDGSRLAFVRDFDLHLLELESGRETALTTDGVEGEILNGVAAWVYWEEIWERDARAYWWSPDGRRIAFYRFDESPVPKHPLLDFAPLYPDVTWQRYPVAGQTNPRVAVGVIGVAGGEPVWLDTGDDPDVYLARVDWEPDGEAIAVQRLAREHDRLEFLRCEPDGGTCRTLATETWPTWVNLSRDLRWLDDGRFLWTSEKSGWRAIYLHAASGEPIRRLSPEGLAVTSIAGFDAAAGEVVYVAHPTAELGARHRQVLRQGLDGSPPTAMSPAEAWSEASPAPAGGAWIHTWSDASRPRRMAIRGRDGEILSELPSEPPAGYDPAALPQWRFFTLPGPGGSRLPAALLEPAGRRPGVLHPAIMYHYGGPASQVVADRWGTRGRDLWHRMMAQRGYAVLRLDNLGSRYFGKHGEDRMHRRFGEINLAAQRAGVEYLAGLGWVDRGRIGLWGWSGGGSNTLYAVLHAPGTWGAAVSGAPVTDWRLYDTIWTERYLDHPRDNPDGYRDSSPLTAAAELRDPLLVVHGTADDNVHPQNTYRLAAALVAAGRPFEMALYPGQKHGFEGADRRHFYERMTEFFERHLGGASPAAASGEAVNR